MEISDLTNPELVTLAVSLLGGESEYVEREDIAITVNEIAPGRFGWRKHPEWIDLDAVGVALRDAKKGKNRGLLVGSNSQGWMLSLAGLRWINSLGEGALPDAVGLEHRRDSISANLDAERLRLRKTEAHKLFTAGMADAITLRDFQQFARVNEYFQAKARQRRYTIVANAVAGDEVLQELWGLLKQRFIEEVD